MTLIRLYKKNGKCSGHNLLRRLFLIKLFVSGFFETSTILWLKSHLSGSPTQPYTIKGFSVLFSLALNQQFCLAVLSDLKISGQSSLDGIMGHNELTPYDVSDKTRVYEIMSYEESQFVTLMALVTLKRHTFIHDIS